MAQNFYIPINNSKKRPYTIFANLILLVSLCFYSFIQYYQYRNNEIESKWFGLIFPIAILLLFVFRFFYILLYKKFLFTNLHFAVITATLLALSGYWLVAVSLFIFGLLEYIINKDYTCTINHNGVHINSFPPKKYNWDQLQNLVLTQGVLTIDTKQNSILQIDVSEETIAFTEKNLQVFITNHLR